MTRSTRHSSIRWLLLPDAVGAQPGALVALGSEKIKHLRKVLRMEWDEPVLVTDGAGRLFDARLEKAGDAGKIRLEALVRVDPPPLGLELAVCLPKNSTMDWVVEKAVECGASLVIPVVSARSVVRPDPRDLEKYARRWQAIMDEAVEQSERVWRPAVKPPVAWNEWLPIARAESEKKRSFAFVSETRLAKTDEQALAECWRLLRTAEGLDARALIGPEGGFSEAERASLASAGFAEASLGSSVLRVETAVVAALTLLRFGRSLGVDQRARAAPLFTTDA